MSEAEHKTQTTKAPHMQRAKGRGRLQTQQYEGRTRIAALYQEGCAKIRLPTTHSSALEAIVINTAGGLTGGDELEWEIEAAEDARLVVSTQACERIYKSTGADAQIRTKIKIADGAHVDWLPQETLLFEQSKLDRQMFVELSGNASFTGVESILMGREAMGEAARTAMLSDNWRIKREGKLIHAEANRLSAADLERDSLSLLAGNNAFATVVHISQNAQDKVAGIRAGIPDDAKVAVSAIGERLIVRLLAPSGLALRRLITPIIAQLSGAGTIPRVWTT